MVAPSPRRTLVVVVCAALATGAVGWIVGTQVRSPADAAAEHRAPSPSLVTAPVLRKALTSTVVIQGTVAYSAATPLALNGVVGSPGESSEKAQLITKAPSAGGTVKAGDVLLEVSGRPVFVLPGEVPMYRTLTPGSKGDDVKQLQAALVALGHASGLRSGTFDNATATAVGKLYARAGYEEQKPTAEQRRQLRTLEQAVDDAKAALDAVPPDADRGRAHRAHNDAKAELNTFRASYGTSVPSGEVLFLPRLPVRLDAVTAKAGAAASGQIGTVTDPTVHVQGAVPTLDARLLRAGLSATLLATDGTEVPATLDTLGGDTQSAASTAFRIVPKDQAALAPFAGQAVRVTVQVGATEGEVLVVPVAAVITGADGRTRVRVVSAEQVVRDVSVRTGLTAFGEVHVTPLEGVLAQGDRVLVGGS
ncbi:peptidoglycan-binding protein [Allokutzneria sp. NRRL B-24872]|uniref:peptidoglycan-binding protein n=1 Tax=Allokutzneria sp. NRRL B-24872 TaxID=1137961 RepID=UPI000A38BD92|nr:peptidoglycan-binding protein [Allokutzneria sp. NRRL B-24872]